MGRPQRFRGVRQRQWGSWVSEFRHPITKRRVWLGTFETEEDAALAYDEAARFVCGIHAKTNFPFHPSNSLYFIPPLVREKLKRSMHYDYLLPSFSTIGKSSKIVNDCRYRAKKEMMDLVINTRYASFSWMNEGNEKEEVAPNPSPFLNNNNSNNKNKNRSSNKVSSEEELKRGHGDEMVLEMMEELLNCMSNSDVKFSLLSWVDLATMPLRFPHCDQPTHSLLPIY